MFHRGLLASCRRRRALTQFARLVLINPPDRPRMAASTPTLSFIDDTDRHRFEALDAGKVAGYVEYNMLTSSIMLVHTEVLPEYEGKGVGSFLARESLAAARNMGK